MPLEEFEEIYMFEDEDNLVVTDKTERIDETFQRCVEGAFRIQKWHMKLKHHNYSPRTI